MGGAALWNLAIGGVMLVGGLSGRMSLLGTSSSTALAVFGGAMMALGVYQVVRAKR